MSNETPSQTVGPYFAIGLTPQIFARRPIATSAICGPDTPGEQIRLAGQVLDGAGQPVEDAMIEVWQADADGRYAHPADQRPGSLRDPTFRGFGRAGTNATGDFCFDTVKPGAVPGPGNTLQAPHLNVIVFSRGMLTHAFTRVYFDDEATANETDPVLSLVDQARRGTLIARRKNSPTGTTYRFDIHLQGKSETVFLDP
ncbi:MAG TPA: protocatechuate 3,4-dioxygenase subunit alpha [Xanthobacteraceae bacterium]|jgi:protocatechuate 3,4-dioxygenase alpha subunit